MPSPDVIIRFMEQVDVDIRVQELRTRNGIELDVKIRVRPKANLDGDSA